MDLDKYIKENYNSRYAFAKKHNISNSLVNYWCNKDFEKMSYKLRCRILNLTNK